MSANTARSNELHNALSTVGLEDPKLDVRRLRRHHPDNMNLADVTDKQLRDMFPEHGTFNRMRQYLATIPKVCSS